MLAGTEVADGVTAVTCPCGCGGPRQLWWLRSCAPGLTAQKEGLAELPAPPAAPTPPGLSSKSSGKDGKKGGSCPNTPH